MNAFILATQESADGTFLHWMLASALTVLVLDVIFAASGDDGTGTVLYCIVLEVFSGWGVWRMDMPIQWSVLVFLLFSVLGLAFYFVIWKKIIFNLVTKHIMKNAPNEQIHQMVGKKATVCGEGENMYLKWQDELYPIADENRDTLKDGDRVTITAFKDGVAHAIKD